MAKVDVVDMSINKVASLDLPESIFSCEIKPHLMHEVVVMQLASRRSGTHSAKTRSEVSFSGAKPWRQKGTGRARAGTKASPLWRTGGVAFGPKPRDYSYSIPKKKRRSALRSALSAKHVDGAFRFFDNLSVPSGKTKDAAEFLKSLGVDRKVLLVHDSSVSAETLRAMKNIPFVRLLHVDGLNVYDVINARCILMPRTVVERVEEVLV